MRIIHPISALFVIAGCAFAFSGCKSEDVNPAATLQASTASFDFDRGQAEVHVVLNGVINRDISFPISFSGTAIPDRDYTTSAAAILVRAGSDRGSIILTGIPTGDTSIKTVIVTLLPFNDAEILLPDRVTLTLVNCNGDRDGDGITDCLDECPDDFGPAENNGCPWLGLIINEVLYDPAADLAGDANGDGIRDPLADEFVELYNSNDSLDISGYTLSDASMVRHTFPTGTILPSKGVIVVFGGGTPTGDFGGAMVQVASEGQLNLNNAGDILTLKNAQGATLAVFDINGLSGNPDESYTRNPDIKGSFQQHSRIPAASGRLFSPGTRLNGQRF